MKTLYSSFLLLLSMPILAQVTIGSSLKPTSAALLELKSQEPDERNVTSNTGGFILSRVALENLTTLEPFISTNAENYDKVKRDHTGLFVYNVTNTDPFVPGLYFWDGAQWNVVMASANPKYTAPDGDDGGKLPEIPSINKGLTMPNSYIVTPGSTINIPIVKAYSVWELQLDSDASIEQHEVTTELLWQDERDMVSKVSLSKGSVNEKSMIQVKTTKGIEGNAVVVVKMNGIVRWSWHLWITDYNPSEDNALNICDKATFMNRYLGATSASQGHVGSIGLLYQWGRKDPFSASASTAVPKEKEHYTIDNKRIANQTTSPVIEKENIQSSIINPNTYYTSSSDWYSNGSLSNNYLWVNTDGSKGVYDPCPEGWRLPSDNSVWQALKGKGKQFDKGKGPEWLDYGYYHASGKRNSKGELVQVGSDVYVWTARNFWNDQAFYLGINDWNTYPEHVTTRANAHSVRCVKSK